MKKILACSAALSLMLIACGDDASSTSPDPSTGGEKKTNAASDYHPGECRTDIACARNEDGKAYLISGENDGYQVVVPFVSFPRSAWIDGDFFSERSGDTLYVWDEQKESNDDLTMAQLCVADLVFDISAEDADIKFFKHFDDVYEVEPGPVPTHIFRCPEPPSGGKSSSSAKEPSSSESPSSSETPSSSGAESSSSFALPVESSSSSEFRDGGIARTNDFSIRCVDAGDVREQASAYKSVAGDVVVFALQNVQFDIPCDAAERDEYIEFLNTDDTFPIGHEGDTLYVRPLQSKGIDYACSCAANATFTLDKNYSGINYTVFDQEQILPVQEN